MIQWLKKINRSRNHHLKIYKFKLKLNLISVFSVRIVTRKLEKSVNTTQIVIPFIGKGIGDAIVISGLVDSLANNGYKVSVVADKKTHFLFEKWTNLHKVFFYDLITEEKIIEDLKRYGDYIFIDPHEITQSSTHTFNIIRRTKPIKTIGFNKGFVIYDHILDMSQPFGHISCRCIDLLDYLGVKTKSYNYVVHIPEGYKKEAIDYIKAIGNKKIVIFNPYGGVSRRYFSTEQIQGVLDFFAECTDQLHIVIIGEEGMIKDINVVGNASVNPFSSFFTAAQLIKESHLIITPDTSIVHLCRAFNKRMLCFYPFKNLSNGEDNADVWAPNYDKATQIRLSEECLMDVDMNLLIGHIRQETNRILESS